MTSIDYESLLEFEESLRSSVSSDNSILLYNLELKIDSNRLTHFDDNEDINQNDQYLFDDLTSIMNNYDFKNDDFTTCTNCGKSLSKPENYSNCCQNFVDLQSTISSSLEKSYWLSFINNPSRTINTLPNYTEMLFLQQGIPCQLRSMIWQKLILIDCQHTKNNVPKTSKLIYNNFQHSYTASISKQISKDLCRTFPSVSFFKIDKTIEDLSTILNVYANYDVELGYCQGLLFLVGALHYHFNDDCILTFHSLCSIMESERELHDIFTTSLMSSTLNKWYKEFCSILSKIDNDLYNHMIKFVEFQVFLFQWWLSFISSHTPDLSIVNRIMDFCLIQGWKVGFFKISIGLLIVNKPIIMSLKEGDEEVVYQHLLNDSKWGNIINDLDMFFGNLLLSWDDSLFLKLVDSSCALDIDNNSQHSRTGLSVIDKIKGFKINNSNSSISSNSSMNRNRSDSDNSYNNSQPDNNNSSLSVFSLKLNKPSDLETESLFSDITSNNSHDDDDVSPISATSKNSTFSDFWKLPKYFQKSNKSNVSINEQQLQVPPKEFDEPNTPLQQKHHDFDETPQLIQSTHIPSISHDHNSSINYDLHHDHDLEKQNEALLLENEKLKFLLKKTYDFIDNDELKLDISNLIDC